MEKAMQEKISRLQALEQHLQQSLSQRQQFQTQVMEIDSALKELEATDKAYKIIGNIMVATKKADLQKQLAEKKELSEMRVATLEKNEKQLREKADKLKEEVMSGLEKK